MTVTAKITEETKQSFTHQLNLQKQQLLAMAVTASYTVYTEKGFLAALLPDWLRLVDL